MAQRKKFSSHLVPALDVDVTMLTNLGDLSNDDLEEITLLYPEEFITVRLADYLDVRHSHLMCTAVLKVTREENAELTRVVRDEFATDKATTLSVRAMTVMEKGIRKALAMVKDYRSIALASKKNGRPRTQRLDQIIDELEKVCPVDNIDTFLDHLFKEEREQRRANHGMFDFILIGLEDTFH